MNIEQAIAYFEDAIRESDEIIVDCSEALQAELTEQKEHFVAALSALRAQQERENPQPCVFCSVEHIHGAMHCKNVRSSYSVTLHFKFCPNCGRKLKPKEESI
jgi:NADH pyrophosphatase NudC (nudix superfamily)